MSRRNDMSDMNYRYPEGAMFDNEGTELNPDPDERTDSDMEAMYGEELRGLNFCRKH